MALRYQLEDDIHAEVVATFVDGAEALAFVERLRGNLDAAENRAPCTGWRTCRRDYYLLKFDDATEPWTLLGREGLFTIDFATGEVASILSD